MHGEHEHIAHGRHLVKFPNLLFELGSLQPCNLKANIALCSASRMFITGAMLPDCQPVPIAACAQLPAPVAACASGEGRLLDGRLDAGLSAATEECRLDAMLAQVREALWVLPG